MLLRVLVALCFLAVTGCLAQNVDWCEELTACTGSLSDLNSIEGLTPLLNMTTAQAIDFLCNEIDSSHTCVDNLGGVCRNARIIGKTRSILDVGDHMCDPNYRDDMEELLESECFSNQTVGLEFGSRLESCAMDFVTRVQAVAMAQYRNRRVQRGPDPTAFCPLFHDLETCMVEEATDVCGSLAGEMTSTIWDIAIRNTAPPPLRTCFTDVLATRRAVEHVMPAMVKRHFEGLDWILGDLD